MTVEKNFTIFFNINSTFQRVKNIAREAKQTLISFHKGDNVLVLFFKEGVMILISKFFLANIIQSFDVSNFVWLFPIFSAEYCLITFSVSIANLRSFYSPYCMYKFFSRISGTYSSLISTSSTRHIKSSLKKCFFFLFFFSHYSCKLALEYIVLRTNTLPMHRAYFFDHHFCHCFSFFFK